MSEPFLAEIRMVGFNFAPRGWAFCDGQILPINQNQSLYSLLGTNYGGDGRTTFALPDLRGRTPIHETNQRRLGQKGGAETVTLTSNDLPAHRHTLKASSTGANSNVASNNILANTIKQKKNEPDKPKKEKGVKIYRDPDAAMMTSLSNNAVSNAGGGQAHNNMQPYLTINFCIALRGLFPSRN